MKYRWRPIAIALCALSFDAIAAQPAASPAELRVYDATQLAMARYTVIKRLWVENWQSAFDIATYATIDAGRKALIDAAAAVGADGVMNLACIPRSAGLFERSGYLCYGNAIRLKTK